MAKTKMTSSGDNREIFRRLTDADVLVPGRRLAAVVSMVIVSMFVVLML